jgi:hypothetical protein
MGMKIIWRVARVNKIGIHTNISPKKLKERCNMESSGVNANIILKCTRKEWGGRTSTGIFWA